jgi:hypothetical protein
MMMSIDEDEAALEWLKRTVRAGVPAGMIDAAAHRLVGESPAAIDNEARDLFEALQRQLPPFSRTEAFGLALALREVVRDRIHETKDQAT